MTFDEFVKAYDGKKIEYDGNNNYQCVDEIKCYMDQVLDLCPKNIGNAEAYWNRYDELPLLHDNFQKIENNAEYKPMKRRYSSLGQCTIRTRCSSTGRCK